MENTMATVEKMGNQYRMAIGTSDHHEIWQMLPEDWSPGPDDIVLGEEAEPAHVEEHPPPLAYEETTTKKSTKHAR
jgi:hypothetical protein